MNLKSENEYLPNDDAPYVRLPLRRSGSIPVFCASNEYRENYEKISDDHLTAEEKDGRNPFMDPTLWDEIEDCTVQIIEKHVPTSSRVLDVGVGTGRLLTKLGEGYSKYGVDISERYLNVAANKGIKVCMAFVEDLPYPSDFFDGVISTDVLEHVLDLNSAVREMLRVVRPGGMLIVRVPYRESLKAYLDSKYKYVHLRNFDEYSLIMLFSKIFDSEVVEFQVCGGAITREHLKDCGANFLKSAFFLLIHATQWINRRLWRRLANAFYPPSEIVMVVRKPSASS
jgi:ubiquinone/menaquinone biosynthesis C-methylase UbiE